MHLGWPTLLVIVVVLSLTPSTLGSCPLECHCDLDDKGRFKTACNKGGMRAIPVAQMDEDMEVLEISGAQNNLAIGPIFIRFQRLESLRIVDANVPAIGKNSLWGVKSLRILDLQRNNITQLADDHFRGQDQLIELDLSSNKLDRMPSAAFHHLTDLRILNLASNSIHELPQRLFFKLIRLKYLDMSGNPLDDLPPDVFKDIQNLKVLKCRGCQLKHINAQLYNLVAHLVELDLGDNQLKFLDKAEFVDLRHLRTLRLDGNQLSALVNHLFSSQRSLEVLDVARNRLAKIAPRAFESLANLTALDVSYNKLTAIEEECFHPLLNLRAFNVSGNVQLDLNEVRPSLKNLQDLSELAVADIGVIPTGFLASLGQLRALNLSGNHLDNSSLQLLDPVTHLEVLDMSRNQLYGVEEHFADRLRRVRDVRLDNNPLICDRCHMGPLIDRAKELTWPSLPECFLPELLRGSPIDQLGNTELDTCIDFVLDEDQNAASTSHNFLEQVFVGKLSGLAVVAAIAFILVASIILLTAVCFSRSRARRYYTNEEKRGGDSVKAEKSLEPIVAGAAPLADNEINFKFPLDDKVCTIDELCLPPPPPPPGKSKPTATAVATHRESCN